MGREAICQCRWAGVEAAVKVLLESGELILRGEIRKRIRFADICGLTVAGEDLRFSVGGDAVSISLGSKTAATWATAIAAPPTLAKKLGITSGTRARVIGDVDDAALEQALAEAHRSTPGAGANEAANLIVARIDTMESLQAALRQTRAQRERGVPIWIIYPKGKGHDVSESSIRNLLREVGMIDTKVASVSARLSAQRFILRKL